MDTSHPCSWIRCPKCGSTNAVFIDWRPDPDTTLKCPDCESRCDAAYHDDCADEVY